MSEALSVNQGEKHGMHKLTEAQVLDIRKRFANGETLTELSMSYDMVERPTIHKIIRRVTWRHI